MSTETKTYCDIRDCGEESTHAQKSVSVAFVTEQTEGRSVSPYLQGVKLDFCEEHYQEYIDRLPFRAKGAQGFNDYYFTKATE